MKNILYLLLTLAFIACQPTPQATETITSISGKIINPKGEKVTLRRGEFKQEIEVDKEGAFSADLKGLKTGIYNLHHGNEATEFYIVPDKDLEITLDTEAFDETVSYSGEAAGPSNYLAKKYLRNEQSGLEPKQLYVMEESDFLEAIQKKKADNLDFLKSFEGLLPAFQKMEERALHYEYLKYINNYGAAHGYLTGNPEFTPSEELLEPLAEVSMDNEEEFLSIPAYKQLALSYFASEDLNQSIERLSTVKSAVIRDAAVNQLKYYMRPSSETLDKDYRSLLSVANDKDLKKELREKYELFQTLAKGMPSPVFSFEDRKGRMVKLEELKGKNVYIDVWATWCGPCKREIPDLKKLEAQYHDRNIEFVSISIDKMKDKEKWLKMIEEKELGGIQLFSDKDWKSDFVVDYGIRGIPRFILLDHEGKIVSADAPRPSSGKEIRNMIEELKI